MYQNKVVLLQTLPKHIHIIPLSGLGYEKWRQTDTASIAREDIGTCQRLNVSLESVSFKAKTYAICFIMNQPVQASPLVSCDRLVRITVQDGNRTRAVVICV